MLLPVWTSFLCAQVHGEPLKADSFRSTNHSPVPPGARASIPAQLSDAKLPAEADRIALVCLPANAKMIYSNSLYSTYIWNTNACMFPIQKRNVSSKGWKAAQGASIISLQGFAAVLTWKEINIAGRGQWALHLIPFL